MGIDQITFKLLGHFCNQWPNCRIALNNKTYHDGPIVSDFELIIQDKFQTVNYLEVEHYGKYFGEQGIWDTQVIDNKTVADRAIQIVSIVINEVEIYDIFFKLPFYSTVGEQHTHYLGHNGVWRCEFPENVYSWIIQQRHFGKTITSSNLVVETSHSELFDYTNDITELEELENLIKQNAYLFDKSSKT